MARVIENLPEAFQTRVIRYTARDGFPAYRYQYKVAGKVVSADEYLRLATEAHRARNRAAWEADKARRATIA